MSASAVADGSFIGREVELARIDAALHEVREGRGRSVMLIGEPGIGKSGLADRAAGLAQRQGMSVLWGRCWEAGGAPAYWPWLDVLSQLAARLDAAELRDAVGDGASLVVELLPGIRARLPDLTIGAAPPADEARFRLWRAVAAIVRRAAQPAGLAIVLEDLHAADRSSLLLLHFLARDVRSMRLLLLGTYRDVEARMDAEAGALLGRIGREGITLPLARLDPAAATSLIRQRAGAAVPPAIEAEIVARTQGNPLFVEEMVRLFGEQGEEAIAAGVVPQGVRALIRQRLDRVVGDARPLLDLAAVAGDEIDPALLAAASGRDLGFVGGRIEEAIRAGVLAQRGPRRLFSHALVREVLYHELPDDQRRALHGKLAAAMEGSDRVAELAHHALSGPPELLARAVTYATLAAARAQQLLGYDEAVSALLRAAAAVEAAGNQAQLRARVALALGEAYIRRGEGPAGQTSCREAASLARTLGDAELAAQAALAYGRVFVFGLVDPVLVGMLEESLEALPPGDSALRARLLARLGAALQPSATMEEPVAVVREAIATARRLGDPATLLETMHDGMAAMMDTIDPKEQLALNLEIRALAHQAGDRERLLRTAGRLALASLALGELQAADDQLDELDRLAEQLRAPWYAWRGPMLRSVRPLIEGRFAEAERLAALGAERGRAANDRQAERLALCQREALLRASERHDEMMAWRPQVEKMWTWFDRGSTWQAGASALVCTRLEDAAGAKLYLDRVPDEACPPANNLFCLFFLAEPVAFVGQPRMAERLYQLLVELPDEYVLLGMSYISWEGPKARLMALLAERFGRREQAAAHFEDALGRLRRLGARPYLARTEYEYGRALLAWGLPAERARAEALLRSARAGAEALGMSGLVRLAQARLDAPPAGASVEAAPAREARTLPLTFALEGEYWTLAHEGVTFRLKDSLGLQYLVRLFREPGREIHVLDLAGGDQSGADGGANEVIDLGDSGEMLDEEARADYRRRLEDLRETAAEAESFGDGARATRAREEIEMLAAELGRAVGLGGRSRRAGAATERARSAVQRRIKNALQRIGEHAPGLADYLGRTVKTGNFCCFRP